MRELIRTPKFKETVIILLNSIDPPAARSLVRTLFWQDPGLLMSVMGSLPALINVGSEALAEVAAQMNTMPAPLLRDFLDRVVGGIDGAAAGEAAGGLVSMLPTLDLADKDSGLKKSLAALGDDFGRAYAEAVGEAALTARLDAWMAGVAAKAREKDSATYAFIQATGEALKSNPDFVEHVLRPLLEPALQAAAKKGGASKAKKPAKKGSSTAKKPAKKGGASKAKKPAKPRQAKKG
jgi:hypothetical protein